METKMANLGSTFDDGHRSPFASACTFVSSRHWTFKVGSVLLALVLAVVFFAQWVAPYDPAAQDLIKRLQPPSAVHWLGTDHLGRDVLSRLLVGGQFAITISAITVIITLVVGTLIGTFSTADADAGDEHAALVEIEPALAGLHLIEGRARDKDDLGLEIAPAAHRPVDFGGIVTVDEHQILAQLHQTQRIDPGAARGDQVALGVMNVVFGDDRGIEQPFAPHCRRREPFDRFWSPHAVHRLVLHLALERRDPARGLERAQLCLDRGQEIGFDNRKGLAHLAVVGGVQMCGDRPSGHGSKAGAEGEEAGPGHRIASPVPMMWARQTKPMSA